MRSVLSHSLPLSLFLGCGLLGCSGGIEVKDDTGGTTTDTDSNTIDPIDDSATITDDDSTGGTDDSSETPPEVVIPDVTVDCNGGADHTTIQAAIDAASDGDLIEVAPCTYYERLDFNGKSISLYGLEGSADTIIDGELGGTVVDVEMGESAWTRISGFTIKGGLDSAGGAGFEIYNAVLEMEDIVITGCDDAYSLVQASIAFVDMIDVTMEDNDLVDGGYGIYADGGGLTARRLKIDCGEDGGYAIWQHHTTILDESELTCDLGYGIYSYHGEMNVRRSTIYGGIAGIYTEDEDDTPSERMWLWNSAVGGGSVGLDSRYVDVAIVNSVLWGGDAAWSYLLISTTSYATNSVFTASACGISGDSGAITVSYSAFWDNAADTCAARAIPSVSSDPQFVSFPDDLSLQPGSPLEDAGDPLTAWDDLDGSTNDIGRYGGPGGSG